MAACAESVRAALQDLHAGRALPCSSARAGSSPQPACLAPVPHDHNPAPLPPRPGRTLPLQLERHNQRRRELSARKAGTAGAASEASTKASWAASPRSGVRRRVKRAALSEPVAATGEAAASGASATSQPSPTAAAAQHPHQRLRDVSQGMAKVEAGPVLDPPPEVLQALLAQPLAVQPGGQGLTAMEVVRAAQICFGLVGACVAPCCTWSSRDWRPACVCSGAVQCVPAACPVQHPLHAPCGLLLACLPARKLAEPSLCSHHQPEHRAAPCLPASPVATICCDPQVSGLRLRSPMPAVNLTDGAYFDPPLLLDALPPAPRPTMGGLDACTPPPPSAPTTVSPLAPSAAVADGWLAGGQAAPPLPGPPLLPPAGQPVPRSLPQSAPAVLWQLQQGPAAGGSAPCGWAVDQRAGSEPAVAGAAVSDFDTLVADLFAGVPARTSPGSPGWLADLLALPPAAGIAPPPDLPRPGVGPPAPGAPLPPQSAAQLRELRLQQTAALLPPPQPPPPASLQQALDMIARQSGERRAPAQAAPQAMYPVLPLQLPGHPDQARWPSQREMRVEGRAARVAWRAGAARQAAWFTCSSF